MDTKKSIHQLVEELLEELKAQGYSPVCIKRYVASYKDLLAYASDKGIYEYSEAVGLGYLDFRFGFKLEGFFGAVPKDVTIIFHHLLALWHYQQYGTVEFVTRLRKKPFSCPTCFRKEYYAFLVYCEEKKYAVRGLTAILNPLRRFLAFLDDRHVLHIDDINPAHISEFISIYIDHSQRYVTTIISALRLFFKYLYDEGYIEQKIWEILPKVKHVR